MSVANFLTFALLASSLPPSVADVPMQAEFSHAQSVFHRPIRNAISVDWTPR